MSPIIAVTLSLVVVHAASLLALTVRLRWQAHHEIGRQHILLMLASHVPPNGGIEIDDLRADGSRMRLLITTRLDRGQEGHGSTRTV